MPLLTLFWMNKVYIFDVSMSIEVPCCAGMHWLQEAAAITTINFQLEHKMRLADKGRPPSRFRSCSVAAIRAILGLGGVLHKGDSSIYFTQVSTQLPHKNGACRNR